ncbi:MAG: GspH/FimT family pseudopilin [Steroidobacteraceae bacterium]
MGTQPTRAAYLSARVRTRTARGFTLLELMVVLAIAAVVLGLGAPSFGEFRRNARLTAAANDLLTGIQQARSEAIKRQRPVALCASANPAAANAVCANGNDFAGWIVFEDGNNDCQRDAADALLGSGGRGDAALTSTGDGRCLTFASNGYLATFAGQPSATRLALCDERGLALQSGTNQSAARGIAIGPTGRAEITRDPARLGSWGLTCP